MRRRFMVGSGAKNPVPSNQIWYTTYTGLVDVPFNDNFGASLISNVYENGTGIMTFDGDIDTIPSHAFMDNELNSRFASLMFPDTITNVETYAFVDNQYIDYINLGNGVTIIEQKAFYNCQASEIILGNKLQTIGNGAFSGCSNLTSITIPDSVTSIGVESFNNCTSLASVSLGKSITSIGQMAFYNCDSLTEITIPKGVTSIEYATFRSCNKLASVTIPDTVTTIILNAFYNCDNLTEITLPNSVTTIGDYAFRNCTSLTSVYCKATTPPTGGYSMFNNNASARKIYVPMTSVDAYKSADYWSDYADAIVGYNF